MYRVLINEHRRKEHTYITRVLMPPPIYHTNIFHIHTEVDFPKLHSTIYYSSQ